MHICIYIYIDVCVVAYMLYIYIYTHNIQYTFLLQYIHTYINIYVLYTSSTGKPPHTKGKGENRKPSKLASTLGKPPITKPLATWRWPSDRSSAFQRPNLFTHQNPTTNNRWISWPLVPGIRTVWQKGRRWWFFGGSFLDKFNKTPTEVGLQIKPWLRVRYHGGYIYI